MTKKHKKIWIAKLIDYTQSIDSVWLITWISIFISFVVLDAFFQTRFHDHNLFYELNLFNININLEIIKNGTFIGVTLLKYVGICLSFIYARSKFPRDYILQIALLFTLLADTILTIDQVSVFGVLCFCFAQYFHNARFAKIQPKTFAAWTLFLVLLLMFGNFYGISNIYILAVIYGSSLIGNILLTWRWWRKALKFKGRNDSREVVASTCAFFGFILFILCDINVGISFLSVTGTLPIAIARFANFFAWFFYYPSQILISNSSADFSSIMKKPKNNKNF